MKKYLPYIGMAATFALLVVLVNGGFIVPSFKNFLASTADIGSVPYIVGVDESNMSSLSPADQQAILDNMKAENVKAVRLTLNGTFSSAINAVKIADNDNINVLLDVLTTPSAYYDPSTIATYNTKGLEPPLSMVNLDLFKQNFSNVWNEMEKDNIHLKAIEVGNEINIAQFNGDLRNTDPTALSLSDAKITDLPSAQQAAYEKGLQNYVQMVAFVHQLRDTSTTNKNTLIISAGLSNAVYNPPKVGTNNYLDLGDTQLYLKSLGIEDYIDAYGGHIYPYGVSTTTAKRSALFSKFLSACTAGGDKPCWITEWGYTNSSTACPVDDTQRTSLVNEMISFINDPVNQPKIGGEFYYDWQQILPVSAYDIYRCGSITDAGKAILSVISADTSTPIIETPPPVVDTTSTTPPDTTTTSGDSSSGALSGTNTSDATPSQPFNDNTADTTPLPDNTPVVDPTTVAPQTTTAAAPVSSGFWSFIPFVKKPAATPSIITPVPAAPVSAGTKKSYDIISAQYTLNGALVHTTKTFPDGWSLDTTVLQDGTYTLKTLFVYADQTTDSSVSTFTVDNSPNLLQKIISYIKGIFQK